MKIKEIRLRNYRNHRNTVVECDHINVFCGRNRSGKTSILSAVETVLTGRNEWAEDGRIQDCIQYGEKKAEVTIVGANPVTRVIYKKNTELKLDKQSITNDVLLGSLGIDPQMVRAVCRTDKFMALKASEQQKLLFALIGGTFDESKFLASVSEWAKRYAGVSDIAGFLKQSGRIMPEASNLTEMLESLNDMATMERRGLGRERDRLEKVIDNLESVVADSKNLRFTEENRRTLVDYEAQRDKLNQSIGAEESQMKLAEETRRRVERLRNDIDEVSSVISKLKLVNEEKLRLAATSYKQQMEQFDHRANELRQRYMAIKTELASLPTVDSKSGEMQDKYECPVFAFDCPVSPNDRFKASARLQKRRQELKEEMEKISSGEGRIMGQKSDEAKTKWMEAERQLHDYEQANLPKLVEKKGRLEQELKEAMRYADANRGSQPHSDREKLAFVNREISELNERKNKVEQYQSNEAQLEKLRSELSVVRKDHESWDAVVKATSDTGVRAEIVRSQIATFENRINERLGWLTDGEFKIWLVYEGEFDPRVFRKDRNEYLPINALSHTEQKMVGLAIQDALSHLSGLKILLVDELELFDPEMRKFFVMFIEKVKDSYETIFLGSRHKAEQILVSNAKTFVVENGNVIPFENKEPASV